MEATVEHLSKKIFAHQETYFVSIDQYAFITLETVGKNFRTSGFWKEVQLKNCPLWSGSTVARAQCIMQLRT